jgi:hypothetical protein
MTKKRFTVSAPDGPVWTFTYGVSGPQAASRWYAEVQRVPLSTVTVTPIP